MKCIVTCLTKFSCKDLSILQEEHTPTTETMIMVQKLLPQEVVNVPQTFKILPQTLESGPQSLESVQQSLESVPQPLGSSAPVTRVVSASYPLEPVVSLDAPTGQDAYVYPVKSLNGNSYYHGEG